MPLATAVLAFATLLLCAATLARASILDKFFWDRAVASAKRAAAIRGATAADAPPPDVCALAWALNFTCHTLNTTTLDGFVLTINYLPPAHGADSDRGAVVLQHGLTDSSFTWLMNAREEENLAMVLARRGWHVFLPNSRGNRYSMQNIYYPTANDTYWKLQDMDEMASFDVPAVVDFALKVSGKTTLAYAGHSQGGMQGFAAFSTIRPHLAQKVRIFIGIAPAVFVNSTTSKAFKQAAADHLFLTLKDLGVRNIATTDAALGLVGDSCAFLGDACWKALYAIMGDSNNSNVNPARWPTITKYDPAGTSIYNMIHWEQFCNRGVFEMHDWGAAENQMFYNQSTPPLYTLGAMAGPPTVIFHGSTDALVSPPDVARLVRSLPSGIVKAVHFLEDYNHMDFVWGLDAHVRFFPKFIHHLESA